MKPKRPDSAGLPAHLSSDKRALKELAKAPLIHISPLLQREHHIPREDNSSVSSQSVVRDGSRLFAQLQIELAHLEEGLDIPALTVSLDDLFFRQFQVR